MSEHTGSPAPLEDVDDSRMPMGTLVFGLVVVVVGLLVLLALLYGLQLNAGYVAIGLLVGAGLLLVVGGIASGRKSRRSPLPQPHD